MSTQLSSVTNNQPFRERGRILIKDFTDLVILNIFVGVSLNEHINNQEIKLDVVPFSGSVGRLTLQI